jgi:hypothetical protein
VYKPPEEREGKRENRKKTVECERYTGNQRINIVLTESEKQIIVYAEEQNL